jgi:hypothetical protein
MNLRVKVKNPFKRNKIPFVSTSLKERRNKYIKYYDNKNSKLYNPYYYYFSHVRPYQNQNSISRRVYTFALIPESSILSGCINMTNLDRNDLYLSVSSNI